MSSRAIAEWLDEIRGFEKAGEFFQAIDRAERGLKEHPDDRWLKHRAVLAFANAGATGEARRRYEAYGLAACSDEDIGALDARLLKDQAFAGSGAARRAHLLAAAERYHGLALRGGFASYPAVNAATLFLLAGESGRARAVAERLLPPLEEALAAGTIDYWGLATLIETLVVLGRGAEAQALLPLALAQAGGNRADLASTWRQLGRLAEAGLVDRALFEPLRPATILHYTGHIIAPPGRSGRFPATAEARVRDEIGRRLEAMRAGAGYGSLAAGADILFAEALLARGAELHVVLPFAEADFIEASVRPAGAGWVERYAACKARALSWRQATSDAHSDNDVLFGYCSRIAMGLAILQAEHLGSAAGQIAVFDGRPGGSGPAGTAADLALWRTTGLEQTIIALEPGPLESGGAAAGPAAAAPSGQPLRAMLFGDVKGFSQLNDLQIPAFVEHLLGCLAGAIKASGATIETANTWGDGIFLILPGTAEAARCALAMQAALERFDFAKAGLPDSLRLRIGGHYGPVHDVIDPIVNKRGYAGVHVTTAARIEPVTPEGCVYVTEPFAADLALSHRRDFSCDYVGLTESAKKFGAMRMFLLRRRPA